MFFRDAFLDLIFLYFMLIFADKCVFWTPLGSVGVQNGAPNRPNGAKKAKKSEFRNHTFAVLKPTCFQDRFWSDPGANLVDFGWIFHEILMYSGIIFRDVLLHFLAQFSPNSCLSKLPEQAETCRNTTPQQTKRWQHNRHPQLAPSKPPAAATSARSPK